MKRYRTIDGLRGYAAMAVVLYHLTEVVLEDLATWCPTFLIQVFQFGFLGVPVFFVISGFAIEASVQNTEMSRAFFGNFVFRRSLRLDPPYWAAIVLGLFLLWAKNQYFSANQAYPSPGILLAHLFYLQDILGHSKAISVVFWTLCQEVQLYLFFILTTWLFQRLTTKHRQWTRTVTLWFMLAFGLYSLACDHRILQLPYRGLFFANWHYFLIGILVHGVAKKKPHAAGYFVGWMFIEICFQGTHDWRAYAVCGIITGSCLYAASRLALLDYLLTDRISLYLGSISYSLYLVHADLGWKLVSLGKSRLDTSTPWIAIAVLLTSIGICIACAALFCRWIERPSTTLSRRFRQKWPPWLSDAA